MWHPCCCSMGSIPGPGTSAFKGGHGQKKKKKKKKKNCITNLSQQSAAGYDCAQWAFFFPGALSGHRILCAYDCNCVQKPEQAWATLSAHPALNCQLNQKFWWSEASSWMIYIIDCIKFLILQHRIQNRVSLMSKNKEGNKFVPLLCFVFLSTPKPRGIWRASWGENTFFFVFFYGHTHSIWRFPG